MSSAVSEGRAGTKRHMLKRRSMKVRVLSKGGPPSRDDSGKPTVQYMLSCCQQKSGVAMGCAEPHCARFTAQLRWHVTQEVTKGLMSPRMPRQ